MGRESDGAYWPNIRLPLTPYSEQYHEDMRSAMRRRASIWRMMHEPGQLLLQSCSRHAMSACGGNDTSGGRLRRGLQYQNRDVGKRVVAPEGLDQLDEFAEMPIPKADPEAATAGFQGTV